MPSGPRGGDGPRPVGRARSGVSPAGRWFLAALGLGLSGVLAAQDLKEARRLFLSGDYLATAATAEKALREPDDAEEWHLLLTDSLMRTGLYGAAYASMTNALARQRRSVRLRWLAQDVFRYQGQEEAAARCVTEIAELAGSRLAAYRNAPSLVAFGRAALAEGADPKRVLDRVYETAKRLDPTAREVYLAMGELALTKHDYALAAKVYREGLKQLPDDPDLHAGLAEAYAPSAPPEMLAALGETFKRNTNHVRGLLLLAERRIDEEAYTEAESLLDRVHGVNPWQPEAWSYRALLAHLRNQPHQEQTARGMALRYWTNNPAVDHLIGRMLSQKYRFAEGAAYQRRALALAPGCLPAKAQLAQDLLRLGEESEGWHLAQEVHDRDGYDVAANNLLALRDVMRQFTTLTNAHFVVHMAPREAKLYGSRVLELLEEARERLGTKYGLALARPVVVEVFPAQKDFAVRTFGMPEASGFLGVCFGQVITANSPAARPGHRFNWESMLWHEFCHVVTLQLTRNRMPRWLSEGISVYEERLANPAWGERLNPKYRRRILTGPLTPVSRLSAAFLAPESDDDLQFAYYESSLVVEYLVERFGQDRLVAILRDLGNGAPPHEAIPRHTVPLETLDADFAAHARQVAGRLAPGLDWEEPPRELAGAELADPAWRAWVQAHPTNYWAMMREARASVDLERWADAKPLLEQMLELFPGATGADGAYALLASVHRAMGDAAAERTVLARWAERDGEAIDAYQRLLELGSAAKDWPAVVLNARRYLAVDPLVPGPYRFLALAGEATDDAELGAAAYRRWLELDPPNPAVVHFGLARQLHRLGHPEARRHVLQALEEAPRYRAALRLLLELQPRESAAVSTAGDRTERRP